MTATSGRPGRISPLRAQRERLYSIMRRARDLTASGVGQNLFLARLRSPAWARYNEIAEEAYDCRDVERLRWLLNQASAALDEVERIGERPPGIPWPAVLIVIIIIIVVLAASW